MWFALFTFMNNQSHPKIMDSSIYTSDDIESAIGSSIDDLRTIEDDSGSETSSCNDSTYFSSSDSSVSAGDTTTTRAAVEESETNNSPSLCRSVSGETDFSSSGCSKRPAEMQIRSQHDRILEEEEEEEEQEQQSRAQVPNSDSRRENLSHASVEDCVSRHVTPFNFKHSGQREDSEGGTLPSHMGQILTHEAPVIENKPEKSLLQSMESRAIGIELKKSHLDLKAFGDYNERKNQGHLASDNAVVEDIDTFIVCDLISSVEPGPDDSDDDNGDILVVLETDPIVDETNATTRSLERPTSIMKNSELKEVHLRRDRRQSVMPIHNGQIEEESKQIPNQAQQYMNTRRRKGGRDLGASLLPGSKDSSRLELSCHSIGIEEKKSQLHKIQRQKKAGETASHKINPGESTFRERNDEFGIDKPRRLSTTRTQIKRDKITAKSIAEMPSFGSSAELRSRTKKKGASKRNSGSERLTRSRNSDTLMHEFARKSKDPSPDSNPPSHYQRRFDTSTSNLGSQSAPRRVSNPEMNDKLSVSCHSSMKTSRGTSQVPNRRQTISHVPDRCPNDRLSVSCHPNPESWTRGSNVSLPTTSATSTTSQTISSSCHSIDTNVSRKDLHAKQYPSNRRPSLSLVRRRTPLLKADQGPKSSGSISSTSRSNSLPSSLCNSRLNASRNQSFQQNRKNYIDPLTAVSQSKTFRTHKSAHNNHNQLMMGNHVSNKYEATALDESYSVLSSHVQSSTSTKRDSRKIYNDNTSFSQAHSVSTRSRVDKTNINHLIEETPNHEDDDITEITFLNGHSISGTRTDSGKSSQHSKAPRVAKAEEDDDDDITEITFLKGHSISSTRSYSGKSSQHSKAPTVAKGEDDDDDITEITFVKGHSVSSTRSYSAYSKGPRDNDKKTKYPDGTRSRKSSRNMYTPSKKSMLKLSKCTNLENWLEHCREPTAIKKIVQRTRKRRAPIGKNQFAVYNRTLNQILSSEIKRAATEQDILQRVKLPQGTRDCGPVSSMTKTSMLMQSMKEDYDRQKKRVYGKLGILTRRDPQIDLTASDKHFPSHGSFPKSILRAVSLLDGNHRCCDCADKFRSLNNLWASVTYGILLCEQCAFVHINNCEKVRQIFEICFYNKVPKSNVGNQLCYPMHIEKIRGGPEACRERRVDVSVDTRDA